MGETDEVLVEVQDRVFALWSQDLIGTVKVRLARACSRSRHAR